MGEDLASVDIGGPAVNDLMLYLYNVYYGILSPIGKSSIG
jgi:hypothetical protein